MRLHLVTASALTALAVGCGGSGDPADAGCPDGAPTWCSRDASANDDAGSDASTTDADYIPYLAGEYFRAYVPPGTRYLNDHTLVRGDDGVWHVYGITFTSGGSPFEEKTFLHATAPTLLGPYTDQPDILTADPALNEGVLWAPYAFARAPGQWTMYYEGGAVNPEQPARTLRRANSTDLSHWQRTETVSSPASRPPGGRDPMVLRVGDRWLLYSVGADAQAHGQILVTENTDLDNPAGWSDAVPVITDPEPVFGWGNLESPFVVPYGGKYYLFTTRTSAADADYVRTLVFRSSDPRSFAWEPVTDIRAHAAEVVVDGAGRYFLTSGGWTSVVGEANRGLLIAPLGWARVE